MSQTFNSSPAPEGGQFRQRFEVQYPHGFNSLEGGGRFFGVRTEIIADGGPEGRVYEDPTGGRWYISPNLLLVLVSGLADSIADLDTARKEYHSIRETD